MSFDLTGKAAVITGGSNGIGRAVVERFVKHGARVAILDISKPAFNNSDTPFLHCDVSDETSFSEALALATDALGGVDVLINNAGLTQLGGMLAEMQAKYFDNMLKVNTAGVMYGLKHGGRIIRDGGSIINTSSLAAFLHEAGAAAYHASKAAVVSLTKSAAIELGRRNIRVNAVCPGHTRVERPDMTKAAWNETENLCKIMSPLGRLGEVEDQVGVFHFLASDESKYVTGQALIIDGGFSLGLTPAAYEAINTN